MTRKEYQRLLNNFEMEGFRKRFHGAKKDCGISLEKRCQDSGALPKEEGDVIRKYKAMHEDNFLSSWLREEGKDKEEINIEIDKETQEETSKTRMIEEKKEENETVSAKKKVWGFCVCGYR